MVDKYVLLRFEDYQRLIDTQGGSGQRFDTKTYYHSQEVGLSETRPRFEEQTSKDQLAPVIKSAVRDGAGGGGGGGGGQLTTSKPGANSEGEESGGELAGSEGGWFDIWEGLHFEK